MSKDIKGPWTKCEHNWSETSIYDAYDNIVCTLSIQDEATEGTEEQLRAVMGANAGAIEALPDLLAACERFVWKCENGRARSNESYAQMKAAIEKAKR